MSTKAFGGIDPFESYRKTMEGINEYLSAWRVDAEFIRQARDVLIDFRKNTLDATTILSQSLLDLKNYQLQVKDAFDYISENHRQIVDSVANIGSAMSLISADVIKSVADWTFEYRLDLAKDLQGELPALVASLEKIESEINEVTSDEVEETKHKEANAKISKTILEYIAAILTILQCLHSFMLSSIPEFNTKVADDYSVNYYIEEVNNFYADKGIDAQYYNDCGYRFVSEKTIMPRIKPDCSSAVVEELKLGKAVMIIDKYKKWVQIRWKNEDDTFSYGWIQNYKLSEFKE